MPNLTTKLPWNLANTQWASVLNPLLANPLSSASILKDIKLTTGVNVINHKLGRTMQGWSVVDITPTPPNTTAAVTYYRSAPLNDLTLTLTVSGPATVAIEVF